MEGGELTQTVGDGRSRSGRRAGRAHPTRLARRKGRDGDRKRPHSIRSQDGSPFTLQYPTDLLVILLDDSELHLIGQRMNLSVGRDGKNGLTTHRLDRMSSADNNQTGSGCFHDAGALGNGCDRLNRDVPRSRMGCHPARSLDLRTHERDRNEFLIWRLFRIASRRRKGTRVTDTDVAIPECLHFRNTENSTRDEFARSAVEFGTPAPHFFLRGRSVLDHFHDGRSQFVEDAPFLRNLDPRRILPVSHLRRQHQFRLRRTVLPYVPGPNSTVPPTLAAGTIVVPARRNRHAKHPHKQSMQPAL